MSSMKKATFGAGCFWGVEAAFRKVAGVKNATSGYMGGSTTDPTYKQVCTGETGHAEVVEVDYDSDQISYEQLLETFWTIHDPTTLNRQGPDRGTQYRSAIFFYDDTQKSAATNSIDELTKQKKFSDKIVTEVTAAATFYKAEEYHQRYFEKNGIEGCPI